MRTSLREPDSWLWNERHEQVHECMPLRLLVIGYITRGNLRGPGLFDQDTYLTPH
jgi:hypothetical protein